MSEPTKPLSERRNFINVKPLDQTIVTKNPNLQTKIPTRHLPRQPIAARHQAPTVENHQPIAARHQAPAVEKRTTDDGDKKKSLFNAIKNYLSTEQNMPLAKSKQLLMSILTKYNKHLNAQDENGNTILHIAIINNRLDMTKMLLTLESIASTLTIKNKKGNTPQDLAKSSWSTNFLAKDPLLNKLIPKETLSQRPKKSSFRS